MDFQVLGHVAVPRLCRRHFFFSFVSTDLKVRGYLPSASRLSDALSLCVIFDGWADLISALCLMFCFWFVFRCFANGQWLTANSCFVEFRYKVIALFCYNKIKIKLFSLICKYLLESWDSAGLRFIFFLWRKNFLPRHAEIFSLPCAWRGVKEIYSWQYRGFS